MATPQNRNTQVEPPPIWTPVIDPATGKVSNEWNTWFAKVQYFLSIDSHQTITDAANDINLDAEHVNLIANTASYAVTLNAPTLAGKFKVIQMTERTAPRSVTMSLTNVIGGSASTTATFDAANETLVLLSINNSKWLVIKESGVTLT